MAIGTNGLCVLCAPSSELRTLSDTSSLPSSDDCGERGSTSMFSSAIDGKQALRLRPRAGLVLDRGRLLCFMFSGGPSDSSFSRTASTVLT